MYFCKKLNSPIFNADLAKFVQLAAQHAAAPAPAPAAVRRKVRPRIFDVDFNDILIEPKFQLHRNGPIEPRENRRPLLADAFPHKVHRRTGSLYGHQ